MNDGEKKKTGERARAWVGGRGHALSLSRRRQPSASPLFRTLIVFHPAPASPLNPLKLMADRITAPQKGATDADQSSRRMETSPAPFSRAS